jgi:hypothetical protein
MFQQALPHAKPGEKWLLVQRIFKYSNNWTALLSNQRIESLIAFSSQERIASLRSQRAAAAFVCSGKTYDRISANATRPDKAVSHCDCRCRRI